MPIFNATIDSTPEEVVTCRVFNPSLGQWWNGVAWDIEANAALTVIPSVGSMRHAGPVEYPEPGVLVEYFIDGAYNTSDEIPVPPPTVSLSQEELDRLAVSVAAGVGENLPSPVIIPLVTGGPTTVTLTSEKRISLKRGDSYRLTFSLGRDCTGWTGWFGAKRDPDQEAYDMAVREVTFLDQAGGTGYVDLTSADTAATGTIHGELELRRGTEVNTPESYTLKIVEDIVR